MLLAALLLSASLATTNVPSYYTVYADAVTGDFETKCQLLALPLKENVRGNSTYTNTRRYLLTKGLTEEELQSLKVVSILAATSTNAAEKRRLMAERAYFLSFVRMDHPREVMLNKAREAVAVAAAKPHPRLFVGAKAPNDFATILPRLPKAGCERILADADVYLQKPPLTRELTGYRLLGVARKALTRLTTLALAYRLTNERRYLVRAEAELTSVCTFEDWNPRHFLDTAEIAVGVAVAYDWLYNELTPSIRELAAQALREKALGSCAAHPQWMTLQNNWVQVGAGGMTAAIAALAETDGDVGASLLAKVVSALPEAECVVSPDGAFPEGPSYWNYGFTFNVFALAVMESAFGTDFGLADEPGFRETGHFVAQMTGPSGRLYAFSDGHEKRPQMPALWWFARRFKDASYIDDGEKIRFRQACAQRRAVDEVESESGRDFPIGLLWVDQSLLTEKSLPMPETSVFRGEMPLAVQRSADGSVYVAMKGGSPSYNHGHADEGSFVLDALGERWAFDLGCEDYSTIEKAIGGRFWSPEPDSIRWNLFRLGSQGHNTLLIDGKGQDSRGFASIERVANEAIKSSTAVLPHTNFTGFVVRVTLSEVYPQALAVVRYSAVESNGSGGAFTDYIDGRPGMAVRWAILTDAEVRLEGNTAILHKAGKFLKFVFPEAGRLAVQSAHPANDYESPNTGFRQLIYSTEIPQSKTLILPVTWTTGENS